MKFDLDGAHLFASAIKHGKEEPTVGPFVGMDVRHPCGFNQFRNHRVKSKDQVFKSCVIQIILMESVDQVCEISQNQFDFLRSGNVVRDGGCFEGQTGLDEFGEKGSSGGQILHSNQTVGPESQVIEMGDFWP